MENDELEANVIVVDDDVQATWLELVPGQHQLPQPAPPYGMSIVCCVEENGTTAVDNLPTVTVWWWKMPSKPEQGAAALWSPMRAPGPTSGADPRGILFGIFAILCPLLTLTSRGIIILIFEVCIVDCPKSWSGLLAFAAARVDLGIQDVAALMAFLVAAEMLFSEESGIVWATEPHVDFFVSFIDLAMHQQQLPQVKMAVQDYASRRGVSVQVATDYLAAEFMAEAIWLAKAGAPIYEPLRWILRRTPRPQAAFAWTQIRQRVSRSSGPAWQQ